MKYDTTSDSCYVRFLDYGGYYTFMPSDLKQIRSDFLSMPFQVSFSLFKAKPLNCGDGGGDFAKCKLKTVYLFPMQALEVYLGNVIPPDQEDWPVQSAVVLEELVANQVCIKL